MNTKKIAQLIKEESRGGFYPIFFSNKGHSFYCEQNKQSYLYQYYLFLQSKESGKIVCKYVDVTMYVTSELYNFSCSLNGMSKLSFDDIEARILTSLRKARAYKVKFDRELSEDEKARRSGR